MLNTAEPLINKLQNTQKCKVYCSNDGTFERPDKSMYVSSNYEMFESEKN